MTSDYLNSWFDANKRDFPWRDDPTPYRVWVSEVMLQQTRASVVVSYFERWMAVFPDIATLATAPVERVIKIWEGLGYYSRARNLHAGAQQIVSEFGGNLPSNRESLLTIRGLGPYTVAAILAFGFRKRAGAVDGNVLRVVTRYAWIDQDIQKAETKRQVTAFVEDFLDRDRPWVTAEALIELGATICTPTPRCDRCPIRPGCSAYKRGQVEALPIKSGGQTIEKIHRGVAVIESGGFFLIRDNGVGQIMAGLCEFPYFENKKGLLGVKKEVYELCGEKPEMIKTLSLVTHSFTRFSAKLYPYYFVVQQRKEIEGYKWISIMQLKEMPFSSGHRKIMQQLRGL